MEEYGELENERWRETKMDVFSHPQSEVFSGFQ